MTRSAPPRPTAQADALRTLEHLLLGALFLGAIAMLSLSPARGASAALGWMPLWLLGLPAAGTAGDHHEDEVVLLTRLSQPDDAMAMIAALMHHRHAAELAVEGDAGVEVADMEGDVGEGRRHGTSLPGTAKRCIRIVRRASCGPASRPGCGAPRIDSDRRMPYRSDVLP